MPRLEFSRRSKEAPDWSIDCKRLRCDLPHVSTILHMRWKVHITCEVLYNLSSDLVATSCKRVAFQANSELTLPGAVKTGK